MAKALLVIGSSGNHITKINELVKEHPELMVAGAVHNVSVHHDLWCEIFKKGDCNCDPEVELAKES